MSRYLQESDTKASVALSTVLASDNLVHTVDVSMDQSLTLSALEPVGLNLDTGYAGALDFTGYQTSDTGDAVATEFDLGHAGVDADSLVVLVNAKPSQDFTILRGTGAGGVDQISFGTAPAAVAIEIGYQLSRAVLHGILLEDVTSAASEFPPATVLVSGVVKLSELVNAPAEWVVGQTIGRITLA